MNIPLILLNPNKNDFFLNDLEISYLKEAKKYYIREYYINTLDLVYLAIINSLKRRVEIYGTNEFLNSIDEEKRNRYFRKDDSLSRKLELLNNQVMIEKCFESEIIDEKSFNLLNLFYWFKKNCNDKTVSKDEINSILTLIQTSLFRFNPKFKAKKELTSTEDTTINPERKKETNQSSYENISSLQRRITDISKPEKIKKTKKLKKEDIFIMQHISIPRRRKDDFLHSHDVALKRRKTDQIDTLYIPRRRKEDQTDFISTPTRRKEDKAIAEHPKRRKEDFKAT